MSEKQVIELNVTEKGSCAVMQDPYQEGVFKIEATLPFPEIAKLKRGNANVRAVATSKKPFKGMVRTVEREPRLFHLKNRGIIYLCQDAEYDTRSKKLRITIPKEVSKKRNAERFGPMDGGHTFAAIKHTVEEMQAGAFKETSDWDVPYARILFLVNKSDLPVIEIAAAVNTSLQVPQYTIDAAEGRFDEIKRVLEGQGFDIGLVAWEQNEDKEWHVLEVLQRLSLFLVDRWTSIPPVSMYKSTVKPLQLFTNPESKKEFRMLYPVAVDLITMPEFIESRLSTGDVLQNKKLGKLLGVRKLGPRRRTKEEAAQRVPEEAKTYQRPGTEYVTHHRIENGLLLPMAAAFRTALYKKRGSDEYAWKVNYKALFDECAVKLYEAASKRLSIARAVAPVASDPSYWSSCESIVSKALSEMIDRDSK